jgi:hypothetical protein
MESNHHGQNGHKALNYVKDRASRWDNQGTMSQALNYTGPLHWAGVLVIIAGLFVIRHWPPLAARIERRWKSK